MKIALAKFNMVMLDSTATAYQRRQHPGVDNRKLLGVRWRIAKPFELPHERRRVLRIDLNAQWRVERWRYDPAGADARPNWNERAPVSLFGAKH